ncbi:MAG: hypothetical protein CMJ39_01110 [Phycisphaerae bacterium]|nr:hypothetical protein [Phycisphaerae bacterium]
MQASIQKYMPAFVAIGSIGGFIGDVLQPLGPVLLYSAIFSGAAVLILWILRKRLSEKFHLAFGFLMAWLFCSSIFVGVQWMFDSNESGMFAEIVPGIASLQDRLGLVEVSLGQIEDQTNEINATTARIESSVNRVEEGISQLGQAGGIISDPQTAAQWYSNARMYELKGDFANARRAYLQCLAQMPDKIDAHLSFVDFLKMQEGRVGAREVYLPIARRHSGVAADIALAMLLPADKQVAALESIQIDGVIPVPVLFLLADRFSEDRLGFQTLEDKASERSWLERFLEDVELRPYLRYFADQSLAAEWSQTASSRFATLEATTSSSTLVMPVQLAINISNDSIMVNLSLADLAVDIQWRDTVDGEFVSTGLMDYIDPDTGRKMPYPQVQIPLQDGDVHFEVQYTTPDGRVMGPYDISFNALESGRARMKELLERFWTSWVDVGQNQIWFSHLIGNRLGIKSIRYKFNDDEEWSAFPVEPANSLHHVYSTGDFQTSIPRPIDVERILVQVEYYDGQWSTVREFRRKGAR